MSRPDFIQLRLGLTAAFALLALAASAAPEASRRTRHVFLITTDGMRPQEIFNGVDETLLLKENCGGSDRTVEALRQQFAPAGSTAEERRRLLFPFLSTFDHTGQLFGNRARGGDVHVTNREHFSAPGYCEILTGIADPRINNNGKVYNPNVTVLEWLHQRPEFAGKVAAFASWDLFPFIINQPRAGLPVFAGWDLVDRDDPKHAADLPMLRGIYRKWDSLVYDSITFRFALDYLQEHQPRVFFLSFGETDDWSHGRRYDLALHAAHNFDDYLRQLWEYVQSIPAYKDSTTFVISTDHGRGTGGRLWEDHGPTNPGSDLIWLAVRGPDTAPLGQRENRSVTQNQIAATVAALLGEDYHAAFPATGAAITDVLPAGAEVQIVAHRGASHDAPENTLASERLAWQQGADALENDLQLTRDGRIIVSHDSNVKRTTGRDARIADLPFAELRQLDAGAWKSPAFAGERLPTLEEQLALLPPGKQFYVEIKTGPEIVPELKRVLATHPHAVDQVRIISFNYELLRAIRAELPEYRTLLIVGYQTAKPGEPAPANPAFAELLAKAKAAGLSGLSLNYHWPLSGGDVRQLRESNLILNVWTVDDPEAARRWIALGADSLTTNRPGWLRGQLSGLAPAAP